MGEELQVKAVRATTGVHDPFGAAHQLGSAENSPFQLTFHPDAEAGLLTVGEKTWLQALVAALGALSIRHWAIIRTGKVYRLSGDQRE